MNYTDKAPAGFFGLNSEIVFAGQGNRGVVIRISGSDVLQFIVQDDLTALDTLRAICVGHQVTD